MTDESSLRKQFPHFFRDYNEDTEPMTFHLQAGMDSLWLSCRGLLQLFLDGSILEETLEHRDSILADLLRNFKEFRDFLNAHSERHSMYSETRNPPTVGPNTTYIPAIQLLCEGLCSALANIRRNEIIIKNSQVEKLGAGKTTLLNSILTQEHGYKVAIIENEFGEVNIDSKLVKKTVATREEIFEITNGCVCCKVRGDLIPICTRLVTEGSFDYIIVECSGVADPAPICQTFWSDALLSARTRVDSVVTLVDVVNWTEQLERPNSLAAEQVAICDRVLLTKTDLATPDQLAAVQASVGALNAVAQVAVCLRGAVSVGQVLNVESFRLQSVLDSLPQVDAGVKSKHVKGIASFSFRFSEPFSRMRLGDWLNSLLRDRGADLFRLKGIVTVEDSLKIVFQGVHMIMDSTVLMPEDTTDPDRKSIMVFIGRNLAREELEEGLAGCLISAASHDIDVYTAEEERASSPVVAVIETLPLVGHT